MKYFKTSVGKALKKPITISALETVLLVVCVEIDREFLVRWTPLQRAIAEDWAIRLHFNAADNYTVRVPPKPHFVKVAEGRTKRLPYKPKRSLFTESFSRHKKLEQKRPLAGTLYDLFAR